VIVIQYSGHGTSIPQPGKEPNEALVPIDFFAMMIEVFSMVIVPVVAGLFAGVTGAISPSDAPASWSARSSAGAGWKSTPFCSMIRISSASVESFSVRIFSSRFLLSASLAGRDDPTFALPGFICCAKAIEANVVVQTITKVIITTFLNLIDPPELS
jgi:hypothetical protein